MTAQPRFLQIHTLSAYTAALLNRDDSGLAKRLPYGGVLRTRVSSQCLKRHWRHAEDVHSLYGIAGVTEDFRSRELVTTKVMKPLRQQFPDEIVEALEPEVQAAVYGPRGARRSRARPCCWALRRSTGSGPKPNASRMLRSMLERETSSGRPTWWQ